MTMELNDTAADTGSCVAAMVRAFRFGDVDIRTFEFETGNGAPWIAAQDVCDALGEQSLGAALDRLEESEKRIAVVHANPKYEAVAVINEAGLRNMAAGHFEADTISEWAACEVIPHFHARGIAARHRFLEA